MTKSVRRLSLPNGDIFELPMPEDGGRYVEKPPVLAGATVQDIVVPVAIGVGIGAAVLLIAYKVFK